MAVKVRRVPIASWRRLLARLTPTAIAAGNVRGLNFDSYRLDRDGLGREAVDLALAQQAAELIDEIGLIAGPGNIAASLRRLHREAGRGGTRSAELTRLQAEHALTLAARLRYLAELAEVIALGLGLRCDDHKHDQALDDTLARLRAQARD